LLLNSARADAECITSGTVLASKDYSANFAEPTLIRIASAYEAGTKHRIPPPDFGPVPEP